MDKELAEKLVKIAQELFIDADLYENYSGRYMHGRTTCGVVCDSIIDFFALCVALAQENPDSIEIDDILNIQYDHLGKRMIFY